nr:hypothetical protein [Chloroflexaceae bacterium]
FGLLSLAGWLLTGCLGINRVTYTIPDTYEGFLVIEYDCPNGTARTASGGTVHITFQDNGVACVRESYTDAYPGGARFMERIQTRSGQTVRYQGRWDATAQGYAMTDFSVVRHSASGATPNLTYSIQWVGRMEHLTELLRTDQYREAEASFLEQQLGISRLIGEPRRTPQPTP